MSESADGAHVEATPPTAPNLAPPCTAANRTPWDRSSAKRARRDDRALALVRHLLTHPDEVIHAQFLSLSHLLLCACIWELAWGH